YVDGIVGDVGRGVLRDRRVLAEEGVVIVVVTVDARTGEVVAGPEVITRGWVYAPEAEALLEEARKVITVSLEDAAAAGATDFDTLRRHVRQAAGRLGARLDARLARLARSSTVGYDPPPVWLARATARGTTARVPAAPE